MTAKMKRVCSVCGGPSTLRFIDSRAFPGTGRIGFACDNRCSMGTASNEVIYAKKKDRDQHSADDR